jgi:hypothetical protein
MSHTAFVLITHAQSQAPCKINAFSWYFNTRCYGAFLGAATSFRNACCFVKGCAVLCCAVLCAAATPMREQDDVTGPCLVSDSPYRTGVPRPQHSPYKRLQIRSIYAASTQPSCLLPTFLHCFFSLGFYGDDYEECRLLGCYATWLL